MYLLPLKVPHREIEFWIVFMFLYLFIHSFTYSYFFYYYLFVSLYLIYINQVWHFCFEIVHNSPACIYFHSKCLTARLSFELYLCLFIYSFIHLFVFFFYYYLFVSLNLIYINQVWHFCFEIVQKYTPIYFHSKCVTAT